MWKRGIAMNFLSIRDLSAEEFEEIIESAMEMKRKRVREDLLRNRIIGLLFEKPSTRTRVSFEVGIRELGGDCIYLGLSETQMSRGEPIKDTARVLSRYLHGIIMRTDSHEKLIEMARYSSVPVINALSDLEHPCQVLADFMTIKEFKGDFRGLKYGWIGDGNNVCHSTILASAMTGVEITIASPRGFEPDRCIIRYAEKIGGKIRITNDPREAAKDADVLATDVWVSMGSEHERAMRLVSFEGFQINREILELAKPDVIVMHCLPAHRGEEITEDVLEGEHSVVFEQAENRLHAQKALLKRIYSRE